MSNVKSEVLETIKETYIFLRTTQGPKSFTYKLDRDFISEPGDDIILVDSNNPNNIYEFKVGYDIKKSNFRQNEVYKTIKKTDFVVQTKTPPVDSTFFNAANFKNKILDSLIFKFNRTPLCKIWLENVTESSPYQKNRLETALNLLKEKGYVSSQTKNNLYQKLINWQKFAFDENGNWLLINKLTGNKHQFVDIISNIIECNFTDKEAKEIYHKILLGDNSNDIINNQYKLYFENKIELMGFEWLKNQTKLIELFSKKGVYAENDFINSVKIKSPDAVILYQGGDGDLFDIGLSIDLIIDFGENSKFGVKTIQVKNSENAYQTMMGKYDKNNDFYKYIDWVVYPKKEGGWSLKDLKNS